MFLKICNLIILFFLFSNFNVDAAPSSNSTSKENKEARFTESTEELIVRTVTIDPETHPGLSLIHI